MGTSPDALGTGLEEQNWVPRRSAAAPVLHAAAVDSGAAAAPETAKMFLAGLQYEASKGYHNLQVREMCSTCGMQRPTDLADK